MRKKIKGILIASAVATTLVTGACTQRVPTAGSVTMMGGANTCGTENTTNTCGTTKRANTCRVNKCKVNQCKANK